MRCSYSRYFALVVHDIAELLVRHVGSNNNSSNNNDHHDHDHGLSRLVVILSNVVV